MTSGRDHDIKQLNSLIEITVDSAQGYRDAADGARSSRFSGPFRARAALRFDIAERLQARVKSLGGDAKESGTLPGSTGRPFANLGQKMMGDDKSVIAEVEAAEHHVKEVYQKVVLDAELSDPVRAAVESEFAQIQSNLDEMRDLKQGTA
jgi:uncharacterized protein (TIGR02284 family)